MAGLFSEEWMQSFMTAWNNESDLSKPLAEIGFNSTIAYGFDNDEPAIGYIKIENGVAVAAGAYNGETINWDLRASEDNWQKWMKKGIGMMGLGLAYTSRKLKFKEGDYSAMVKDPRMAKPFIKSFSAMGHV